MMAQDVKLRPQEARPKPVDPGQGQRNCDEAEAVTSQGGTKLGSRDGTWLRSSWLRLSQS